MHAPAPLATKDRPADAETGDWVRVCALDALQQAGRKLVKVGRKQIVLFHGPKGVFACNNRCPHEGYPLIEGSLAEGCILTCNWHNWKFDLEDGQTLVGGDRLRRYPLRIDDGAVWLDVSDPPAAERAAAALESLRDCLDDHDYDRMAREIARLQLTGTDALEAVRRAITWTHDRFEFGTTHAHAAAADWLFLREVFARDEAARLVPLVEIVGSLSWDSLREPPYPYPAASAAFDPDRLVAAIEQEDEAAAVAQVRGALKQGLGFAALERPLARAALAHYQDFGHSAIYVYKTRQLVQRLGESVAEPLLSLLVRSLVYASREDLIPEFRAYGPSLAALDARRDGQGTRRVGADDFLGLDVKRALALTLEASGDVAALYDALLGIGARYLLHYDLAHQERTDGPVSHNVGWLDFTHHVTFANAARALCSKYPELWPQALLQLACFAGRNAAFVDRELDGSEWQVKDPRAFIDGAIARLFDHGQPEYIVSAHLVKLLVAAREEALAAPDAPWVSDLLAGVNRFLHSPLKRKHATRVARQAMSFVALEG
ncbi:MAG: Rieske (2Fe-2S) protein [Kiloniellales bacterium]